MYGCAPHEDHSGIRYEVFYYDRNNDEKVDFERHNAIGLVDADWYLEDSNFNGRYNKKVQVGYAITTQTVNLPVPNNVQISPTPAHLR